VKTKTPSAAEQVEWLQSRTTNLITPEELRKKIERGPIEVKFGVDPTTASLHLGHMVPVFVLKKLQDWGHRITVVIGDFTAYIGDPSGQVSERPPLTREQISKNVATYTDQVGKVLNVRKVRFRRNADWLSKLTIYELLDFLKQQSVSAAMQREDFRKREHVTLAELLYSTLVGIDSVVLKSDLELGGLDQTLNLVASRFLMAKTGKEPEVVAMTPLLRGTSTDGRKMSKSFGNAINVQDDPNEMFGKVMSVPDSHLPEFFTLATELEESSWKPLITAKPRDAKLLLAKTLVTTYHSLDAAAKAERTWMETFSQHHIPTDIPTFQPKQTLKDFAGLLVESGIATSRTDATRLLKGGAVEQLDGPGAPQVLVERAPAPSAKGSYVYRVGKRRFIRVEIR
jgi:tyrosyl-tRNA synthetase